VIVTLDLDGVVVDLVEQLLPKLSKMAGYDVQHDHITQYNIEQALRLPSGSNAEMFGWLEETGGYSKAQPISGAVEALKSLAQQNEVRFASSRPARLTQVTDAWLTRHGIPYSDLALGLSAPKIAKLVDVFVEDDDRDLHLLEGMCTRFVLFDQPWNHVATLPAHGVRVATWPELTAMLTASEM
jgi:uncharacterized HAD superfamily protein